MGLGEVEFEDDEEVVDLNEMLDDVDPVLGYDGDDDDEGPPELAQDGDGTEVEEEPAAAPAPAPAAPQFVQPAPQPAVLDPAEAQRIVAEHNRTAAAYRIQNRDFEILKRRHEQLVTALAQGNRPPERAAEEEEEPIPDPEENLAGHLVGKVNRLEKLTERQIKEREQREQQEREAAVLRQAAEGAMQVREMVGGDVYDDALAHLGRSLTLEAKMARPDLTDGEIQTGLQQMLTAKIAQWGREGLNVGEQLIQYSHIRGWQPRVAQQQPAAPAAPAAPAGIKPESRRTTDPRAEVRRQRDKQKAGRTISSVPGVPAKGKFDVAKYSIGATEEDWDRTVATLTQKAGAGYGQKRPTIGQLLAHKAVSGS